MISNANLGVVVNDVQLGVVLFSINSVLAAVPRARAPVGVHLPNLGLLSLNQGNHQNIKAF